MNTVIIPPSPSWYLSKIINCRSDGIVAYGARHEVVLLKCKNDDFSFGNFNISFIPCAHKDKINSIVFSPSNAGEDFKNSLVTCSDDGSVRIWDFESKELKLVNSGHQDGQKVVDVDWSGADPSLVVSVGDGGVLICWDILSNRIRRMNLGFKITPICLAACPHDKKLVAVGAKSGIILIVNLKGDGSIQSRMRSHESDIVSLSWCPVKHNIFQEHKGNNNSEISNPNENDSHLANGNAKRKLEDTDTKEEPKSANDVLLLASGSKDRVIYFWRAGTDGRYETFVFIPSQSILTGYRPKPFAGDKSAAPSTWICVKWIDPYTLISGSHCGEVLEWDLKHPQLHEKPVKGKKTFKSIKALHGSHSKGLFCIACPALPSRPKNENEKRHVWSTSVDKKLVCTSLKTGKVTAEINTVGGIVYCMSVSPLDPNRIAIGTGDSKILIWNMASVNASMTVLWQRVNGKVMALEWHPTEENLLAFGTGEGRVGLYDVASSKPPIIFKQHHRRSVYRLCWAPHVKREKQPEEKFSLALFSVGDGDVLQMSLDNPDAEPVNLKDKFSEADRSSGSNKALGRTDILWKSDRSLLALGNENGVIYILDGETLVKKHIICAHKKLVQSLRWHPVSVTSDAAGSSPYHNWLATASDIVKVFEVQPDASKEVAVFNLQTEKIVDVAWSPHINGRLISVSYDYTAQVWDVINKTPLVSYLSHHNAVLTAVWSPLDPDLIITGAADNTLRVWRVSEQTDERPTEKRKSRLNNRMKKLAGVPEAVDVTREKAISPTPSMKIASKNENDVMKECINSQSQKIKAKSLFPVAGASLNLSRHLNEHFKQWKESKSNAPKLSGDGGPMNGSGDCSSKSPSPTPTNKDLGYLDFFSDGKAMQRLLMKEEVQLTEMGHTSQLRECMLWRGQVTEMILEAIQKKHLTDWLVALAPMVSTRVWKDACTMYAEQLSGQGEHMKAVGYLIAVHKIEEAIQLLADHKLYREAIALAKCRLPSNDPMIKSIMNDYANYSLNNGQLHLAAHCFLSLDEPLIASQALARCKDLNSLRLAALLALEANADDIAMNLAKNCFRIALIANDFDTCAEILNDHPGLKFLNVWANSYKFISESVKPVVNSQLDWIKGETMSEENSDMIIDRIRQDAKTHNNCYETLTKNITSFIQLDTEKQLWLHISCELSLAGAADCNLVALQHLVKAMAGAHKFQTLNGTKEPLFRLCMLLFPKGPLSQENIFRRQDIIDYAEKEKVLLSSINSYLFAAIFGWLSDNQEYVSEHLKKEDTNEYVWLKNLIDSFRFDLFNSKNIDYFKNEKMIKDLEHKIALSKCVSTNDKIEGRVKLTAVRKVNKSKTNMPKTDVQTGSSSESNSNNSEDKEIVKTDKTSNSSGAVSTIDSVSKTETEVEDKSATEQTEKGNNQIVGCKDELDRSQTTSTSAQVELRISDEENLSSIKEFNLKFESERISVPNPFSSFFEIVNVIQSLTKDINPNLYQDLEHKIQEAWKKANEK